MKYYKIQLHEMPYTYRNEQILAFKSKKAFELWQINKGLISWDDVTDTIEKYLRDYGNRKTMTFKERLKFLFIGEKIFR